MLKTNQFSNTLFFFLRISRVFRVPVASPGQSVKKFIWVMIFGLTCIGFILLFNPFDIAEYAYLLKIKLLLILQGLVFSLSIIFMDWVIPSLIPQIFKKWTVWKALLWYMLVVTFSSFVNFLYKSYWNDFSDLELVEFFNVMYSTSVIGIPIAMIFWSVYLFFEKGQITKLIESKDFLIKMKNDQDFKIDLNNILYINSNDNYVNIHYLQNQTKQKAIFRTTLKHLEYQIVHPLSPIVRCHRKFLINKNQFNVEKASSRSMILTLKDFEDRIKVSSKYVNSIKRILS